MTNIILTQETINQASYKELQGFAKQYGIQSSGKGVTADALRVRLLAFIPVDNATTDIKHEEPTKDVAASVEETSTETKEQKDSKSKDKPKIKLPVLIQENGKTRWEQKESTVLYYAPLMNKHLFDVLTRILKGSGKYGPAVFPYGHSDDENVKGRLFIETNKLNAIIQAVIDSIESGDYSKEVTDKETGEKVIKDFTPTVSLCKTYFLQKGLIITAKMSDRSKFMIGNKMHTVYDALCKMCTDNTEAATE